MDEKKDKCKRCGIKIEPKTKRAEFCSPKCKVYWHRENPKVTLKNFNKPSEGTTKTHEKKAANNESVNTMPKGLTLMEQLEWREKHNL
jgi:hypothetical protein